MIVYCIREMLSIVEGTLIKGLENSLIKDASQYTQMLRPNMLFFLRSKWKVDWESIRNCENCTVVTDVLFEQFNSMEQCNVIKVDDIDTAFWKFINFYRDQFTIPVVAITGTCGKTTTVGMIQHILSTNHHVIGTINSANGRTGHMMYLLEMDESCDVAVLETAVGMPGDITYACKFFKPEIGVITNIGLDHLDKCKTVEAYINAINKFVK